MATLFGMALGGWMSGVMYDLTGSYRAAFVNGIAWNLLNVGIVAFLLYRAPRRWRPAALGGGLRSAYVCSRRNPFAQRA